MSVSAADAETVDLMRALVDSLAQPDPEPVDVEAFDALAAASELAPGEGMWLPLSERCYHGAALSCIVSRGQLELLRKSPAAYHGRYVAEPRTVVDEDTKALRVGRLFHAATVEPERWATFAVPPKVDRRTREGKAAYAQWQAEHPGAEGVDAAEYELALALSRAIAEHPLASQLCSGCTGVSERALIWRDRETGLLCRARIDRSLERPIAVDAKSFGKTPTPELFAREVLTRWYHGQAAFYLDGLLCVTGVEHRFPFVVVHKEPPHEVLVAELGPAEIEMGRREYRAALRELVWRREKNDWLAPWQREPQVITFDGWAFRNSPEWSDEDG
jgi:hypothetical protein